MKNNGFTLIEILAATAILSIIVLVATTLFYNSARIYRKSGEDIEIIQNVRNAMEYVVADLKKVNDSSKVSINNISINGKTFSALWVDNHKYAYDADKKSIIVQDSSNRELAGQIQSFSYTINGRQVSIIITGINGFSLNRIIYLEK